MANVKISDLPADVALTGEEKLLALDGATNKVVTVTLLADFISDEIGAVTVDASPTDGSSNAVSSNGVFDALAGKAAASHTHVATAITQDSTHRFVTDAEKAAWNAAGGAAVTYTTLSGTTWDLSAAGYERKKKTLSADTEIIVTNAANGKEAQIWVTGAGFDLTINGETYTTAATGKQLLGLSHDGDTLNVLWPSEWEEAAPPPTGPTMLNAGFTTSGRSSAGLNGGQGLLSNDSQVKITTAGRVDRVEMGVAVAVGNITEYYVQYWRKVGSVYNLIGTVTGTAAGGANPWELSGIDLIAFDNPTPFDVEVGDLVSVSANGSTAYTIYTSPQTGYFDATAGAAQADGHAWESDTATGHTHTVNTFQID